MSPTRGRGIQQVPTRDEWLDRLDSFERTQETIDASLVALRQEVAALHALIANWTNRQPIYVEMRPRHTRIADGGEGGQREAKRIRSSRSDS